MRPISIAPGTRYGRLVTVEKAEDPRPGQRWRCRCDCGGEIVTRATFLASGNTMSCGCFRAERAGALNRSHQLSQRPEYRIWEHARRRCHKPADKDYRRYGGRGIRMADEWRDDFVAFFEHVGPRPTPAHTLDRIDVHKGYEPGNVQWATRAAQARNKRNNVIVEHEGRQMILSDFAALHGFSVHSLKIRMQYHGCTPHEALQMIRERGIGNRSKLSQ